MKSSVSMIHGKKMKSYIGLTFNVDSMIGRWEQLLRENDNEEIFVRIM